VAAASLPPFLFPASQIPGVLAVIRPARDCPVRTLWSAAACRRFSVVKSARKQSIRSPGSSQEKQLRFGSYVNP